MSRALLSLPERLDGAETPLVAPLSAARPRCRSGGAAEPATPAVVPPAGSATARVVAVLCGLFLVGLFAIELHFETAGRDLDSRDEFVSSGTVPVVLYGAGEKGHCFVNDAYRAVPQGRLVPGGVGRSRMLRLPADGTPRRILCADRVRVVESRAAPIYRLIDSDRAVVAGALGLMIATFLGWPLWPRRRTEVNLG